MKFLEAKRLLSSFEGGEELSFLLAMSGQPEPLDIFLRAAAAELGLEANVRTLPFNTLTQTLHSPIGDDAVEVFLLFPWDLLPEADWRSGVPESVHDFETLCESARSTATLLKARPRARMIYVDAPLPPLSPDHSLCRALREELRAIASSIGADLVEEEVMSFENFFGHGTPLATAFLGTMARHVVRCASSARREPCKVLVTDFDNTLWHGVVGEDGVDGLEFGPHGLGYPHFVYQTFLKALKRQGVLLAGVTKNDPDLAVAPLSGAECVLEPDDFVTIIASYHAKSAQLAQLSEQLNLGLASFVFVDDNPLEIAEVTTALPSVHSLQFPKGANGLPELINALAQFFHREEITSEDGDRTGMYRRRLAGMAPKDTQGADLSSFLSNLEMQLVIRDRTEGDRERAVQLINKTNQFNLNGIRRSSAEVAQLLAGGGRLFTASLTDRHGSHGEILSCLIDREHVIRSLVMSCRVFQRRVEYAFMSWLSNVRPTVRLEFMETARNEPIRHFLRGSMLSEDHGTWTADLTKFAERHRDAASVFELDVFEVGKERP